MGVFRALGVVGLAATAFGAGWLFLVAFAASAGLYENTEGHPYGWVAFDAALGFLAACVAIYGLMTLSRPALRLGSTAQLVSAAFLVLVAHSWHARTAADASFTFPMARS
jgi:hypothetical protein